MRPNKRPNKRLNLLFYYSLNTYLIILALLALITVILATRLVYSPNIVMSFAFGLFLVVHGLIIGFSAPGTLIFGGLEHFFHFSFNSNLTSYLKIIISLIPWIILGFSIKKKTEKMDIFCRIVHFDVHVMWSVVPGVGDDAWKLGKSLW